MRLYIFILLFIFIAVGLISGQVPETISYQGVLSDAEGNPVNDTRSFVFKLYEQAVGGAPSWEESHQDVKVANGLFNVILGSSTPLELPFDKPYWLGITVGQDSELSPRIELTASAYSLHARSIADSAVITAKIQDGAVTQAKLAADVSLPPGGEAGGDLIGTYPNPTIAEGAITTENLAKKAVTEEKIASGQVVRSINNLTDAVTLAAGENVSISPQGDSLVISATRGGNGTPDSWLLGGNSGTNPASNFLGTKDDVPLELRVNNERGFWLEPNKTSPNVIGGFSGNQVADGMVGATIGGGGAAGDTNAVSGNYGTIAGGRQNTATAIDATVGGGHNNEATKTGSTVARGSRNKATGILATVGGGEGNTASGLNAAVPGGFTNEAVGSSSFASGYLAKAKHHGTFVWSDGTTFESTDDNQFLVRASNGDGGSH